MKSIRRNLMTGLLVAGILIGFSGCSYNVVGRQAVPNPEAVSEDGPVMLEPVVVVAERIPAPEPSPAAPTGNALRNELARRRSAVEPVHFLD